MKRISGMQGVMANNTLVTFCQFPQEYLDISIFSYICFCLQDSWPGKRLKILGGYAMVLNLSGYMQVSF